MLARWHGASALPILGEPSCDPGGENYGDHGHQAKEPHHTRGTRSCSRPFIPQRHGLLRRGPEQAHSWRGPLLDRDDAVQLQPPASGGEGERGRQGGRWHTDGAEHHLHLGRHNHGDARDEDIPREPGGDRRLHRACRARPHVRRYGNDRRLRQDHPGSRHGPRQARRTGRHRLFRLYSPGPLQGSRRDDPGCLRGCRGQRRGQDVR